MATGLTHPSTDALPYAVLDLPGKTILNMKRSLNHAEKPRQSSGAM